ncbi:Dbl homology domain-containing protein [Cladochytrium replicatum]|nr:Dbl homology domain-containing protein [Cladochytrium replicatum]
MDELSTPNKNFLWLNTVPLQIRRDVDAKEQERQEVIFELIQTEKEYVNDLELVKKLFIDPILSFKIVDSAKRKNFIKDVFLNFGNILEINRAFLNAWIDRQGEHFVIQNVSDIFTKFLNNFEEYVEYGANQAYAWHTLQLELSSNSDLAIFIQEIEKNNAELRKLPLQSFLSRPTTRMGRYILLLESIQAKTSAENSDFEHISQILIAIRNILGNINTEAGKADNRLKINLLQQQLSILTVPAELKDLNLSDPDRRYIRDGVLIWRKGTVDVEINVILFDHVILLIKRKTTGVSKIVDKAISLDLLCISIDIDKSNDIYHGSIIHRNTSDPLLKTTARAKATSSTHEPVRFPLLLRNIAKDGATYLFQTSSYADQHSWKEIIERQQEVLKKSKQYSLLCTTIQISENILDSKVTYIRKYESLLIIGTMNGLFLHSSKSNYYSYIKDDVDIRQLEIFCHLNMLVYLTSDYVACIPLNSLNPNGILSTPLLETQISAPPNSMFHVMNFNNLIVLILVESSSTGSCCHMFRLIPSQSETKGFEIFKEFQVPFDISCISSFNSMLFLGSPKMFYVLNILSMEVQELLEKDDELMTLTSRRPELIPKSIFKYAYNTFLVCCNDTGFLINGYGQLQNASPVFQWVGNPYSFYFTKPFVIAVSTTLSELWNVQSGVLEDVMSIILATIPRDLRLTDIHNGGFIVETSDDVENSRLCAIEVIKKD